MKSIRTIGLVLAALCIIIPTIAAVRCIITTRTYPNTLVVMKYYDYNHHQKPVEMIGTDQGLFECELDRVVVGSRYDVTAWGCTKVDGGRHRHPVVIQVEKR